jgi:protein-S-isoprenylcysteine O-methyltransferase Ste14
MKPYVETHPIGQAWLVVWVIAIAIELAGTTRRRAEATKRDRGSLFLVRACVIPAALLLAFSPSLVSQAEIRPPLLSALVGIVVFSSGEALRVWSKVALGRYFTYAVMTSADQPVISTGPYRLLRHPSYTGLLLMTIGAGLAWGNWVGVAALTLSAAIGLAYRIHVEEAALLLELGDRYRVYAETHKRIIPYLW